MIFAFSESLLRDAAKKRERRIRVMIVSYTILVLIALGVLTFAMIGPQILESSKNFLPEDIHQYIDQIVDMWPRR